MRKRNDYRVYETTNVRGETLWSVNVGGKSGITITTCRSQEQARIISEKLNQDPWFLDREDNLKSLDYQ